MIERRIAALGVALIVLSGADVVQAQAPDYTWRQGRTSSAATLAARIEPPPGWSRAPVDGGSFAAWLRDLPLKPVDAPVLLHTGQPKARQDVHTAVIDIDTGTRDLQQCADAVMRLRAEWLYAAGRQSEITFNDTGGAQPMRYSRWVDGERPKPSGRVLVWARTAARDASYAGFRRYMDTVFAWAGTHSLERELMPVATSDVRAGDVFIKGGIPRPCRARRRRGHQSGG